MNQCFKLKLVFSMYAHTHTHTHTHTLIIARLQKFAVYYTLYVYKLLELEESLAMSLWVAPPHARYMTGHWVSGVQSKPLSWVVTEDTEHGSELGDMALKRERERERERERKREREIH